ncbi:fungal protein [Schizosaccharomyces cryophilus OY26]|uniref:Fungal protein n=1 Tax=Schizosaccharomyces cryophilus (strain OY26 / ATCC MYA-4695 / CBS 11777 / NBRC 106824 / NRRL Y48691) TaxID=653667 RepID=S9VTW8_SCHCR|nr:uncharacterized protein SPOG_01410 [Schizosaccharomyces cryophilus OY26]EPY49525.1 fungal protein [Schizosaccharomyces cryophilus OY26]
MAFRRPVLKRRRLDKKTRVWLSISRKGDNPNARKRYRFARRPNRKPQATVSFARKESKNFPTFDYRTKITLAKSRKLDRHPLSMVFNDFVDYGSALRSPLPSTLRRFAVFPRYRTLLCLLRSFWDPLASNILSTYFRDYARKYREKHPIISIKQQAEISKELREWIKLVERSNKGDQRYIFEILARAYSQSGPLRQRRIQYLQNSGPPAPHEKDLSSKIDSSQLPYISPLLQIVFQKNQEQDVISKTPATIFQTHLQELSHQPRNAVNACQRSFKQVLPRIALPLLPHEHAHLHQLLFDAWTQNPSLVFTVKERGAFTEEYRGVFFTFWLPFAIFPTTQAELLIQWFAGKV